MKLIKMRCSNCGAELEMDPERKEAYCSFCGTKFVLDDDSVHITSRIVDEARLKEAEVRLRELEYAHEKELREELIRKEQKKTYVISLIAYICVLLVLFSFETTRSIAVLILIVGAVTIDSMRRTDKKNRGIGEEYDCSPKSRLVAVLLCFFFGIFGVHYFYVGRPAKGILYLCTFGLLGFGWLIDLIRLCFGVFRDGDGLYLKR